MMREIRNNDGVVYSSQVTIIYQDQEQPGRQLILNCDPDGLYDTIHQAVVGMSTFGANNSPEEKEKNNLAKLLRVAVKGLLIMYGSRILDMLIGKGHPKPEKNHDIMDWYQDIFTKIGISYLMKNDTILNGRIVNGTVEQAIIGISSVSSRPVTAEENAGATIANTAESALSQL